MIMLLYFGACTNHFLYLYLALPVRVMHSRVSVSESAEPALLLGELCDEYLPC
jgi:hypothetical protein